MLSVIMVLNSTCTADLWYRHVEWIKGSGVLSLSLLWLFAGMWADPTFSVLLELTLIVSLVLADTHKDLVTDTVDNFFEGYLATYPNNTVADVSQYASRTVSRIPCWTTLAFH